MAKKAARRKGRSRKGGQRSWLHSLLWFVVGLALGLAVLIPLLLLSGGEGEDEESGAPAERPAEPQSPPSPESPESAPQPPEPTETQEPSARQEPPAPEGDGKSEYRFYTLLPEMEVEVPDSGSESPSRTGPEPEPDAEPAPLEPETAPRPPSEPEEGLPQASEDGHYLVQVAAFRKHEPAENLKARLALRGLEAQVVTVDLAAKGVWHRVRLGPYTGRAEAKSVRDRLADDGMQGMIVRK